jgi:hypothetical protein
LKKPDRAMNEARKLELLRIDTPPPMPTEAIDEGLPYPHGGSIPLERHLVYGARAVARSPVTTSQPWC